MFTTSNNKNFLIILIIGFIILSFIIAFIVFNINAYFQFINLETQNTENITLEIQKGQNINQIFEDLTNKNLIPKKDVFGIPLYKIYLNLDNEAKNTIIKAGNHTIPPKYKIKDLIKLLAQNINCDEIKITIPEGLRIEEIANIYEVKFKQNNIQFDKSKFIDISKNSKLISNNNSLKIDYPNNLEGFLFPDTYYFCKNITNIKEEEIITKMLNNFEMKVLPLIQNYKNSLTMNQIINLASILERESRKEDERKIVAGILIKRLKNNLPLGVDATSQYGFGFSKKENTWWPKGYDLLIAIEQNNQYNTRKNLGLPPTPISNPGLNTIKAVLEFKETQYWYYLHDDCGNIHYSVTLSEHNQKANLYIGNGCKN